MQGGPVLAATNVRAWHRIATVLAPDAGKQAFGKADAIQESLAEANALRHTPLSLPTAT